MEAAPQQREAVPKDPSKASAHRDCHGYRKPRSKSTGFAGVGVRVGEFIPQQNPYPHHGYAGKSDLFYFQFIFYFTCKF